MGAFRIFPIDENTIKAVLGKRSPSRLPRPYTSDPLAPFPFARLVRDFLCRARLRASFLLAALETINFERSVIFFCERVIGLVTPFF